MYLTLSCVLAANLINIILCSVIQVYLTLCCALAASAVGAYLHILMNIGGFLTMVACIMCMILLLNRPVYYQRKRFGLLMATALFEGASVGPLIVIVLDLDPR